MTYSFYKVLHFAGIFALMLTLGGILIQARYEAAASDARLRKISGMMHGISLFIILLGGFGLLAKLGIISEWPGWVHGKLVIWVLLGGSIALIRRMPARAGLWSFLVLTLGILAAYLAQYKPF